MKFTLQTQYTRDGHKCCSFSLLTMVLIICLGAITVALAQQRGTISGTVTDETTGEALIGANLQLVGTLIGTGTSSDGSFSMDAPAGNYTLRLSYIGYATTDMRVEVSGGQETSVDISLSASVAEFGETVVVIGSRAQRTAVETPVPVDVISEVALRESGPVEINQVLAQLAPSFNASNQTISDGTDHINPASLRGLGPDQVLVLVNGKRRHSSSLVHVNGTFGRGTVGVDLNAIPKSAIERIEVLRDGAAAQYGSDAIAGVINIVLKEQTTDLQVNATTGAYNLLGNDDGIFEDNVDGETVSVSANYGFDVGDGGFFNVTADFMNRERTNRAGTFTGDILPGVSGSAETDAALASRGLTRDDFSMKIGMGAAAMGGLFFNSAVPLGDNGEFYSFGGVSHRKGAATGFYRLPNSESQVDLSVYPNGFLPQIHTEINDIAATAGLRGYHAGWLMDASLTHGSNSFLFNIENTMNASLGAASPVSFDAGNLRFGQSTGNLDLLRDIDVDAVESLTLAIGSEFRVEHYEIGAGQFESYSLGNGGSVPGVDFDTTSSGAPKNSGSQVFPGFQPSNEVDRYRYSIGGYLDLESDITEKFLLGGAVRYENYSDFGNTVNAKVSGRFELVENFALRGAASSGFRAPSLHQVWFNNVSIQFVLDNAGQLVPARVLSASNKDPVTRAFGIPNLKEETSVNFSAGFTARPTSGLSLTADVYQITINDRVVLSSRFSSGDATIGAEVADILQPFASSGVGQAQFFANAVDTKTKGVDIVAAYNTVLGSGAQLTLSGSANFTKTEVEAINVPQSLADKFSGGNIEAVRSTLFDREERNRLEDALPRQKGTASVRYEQGRIAGLLRANYFGPVEYKPTNPDNDESFSAKTLLDIDLGIEVMEGVRWSVGANNVLNVFPDPHQLDGNISSGRFIYSRRVTQFGMNGGFYYTRLSLNL